MLCCCVTPVAIPQHAMLGLINGTSHVQVTLLQSGQTILTTFTGNLQNRALETFRRTGVDVRLGVRVTEVTATKACHPHLQEALL